MYQLSEFSKILGVVHGFSEVGEGNMALKYGSEEVLKNRKDFLAKLKARPEQAVLMEVEHGARVEEVFPQDGGRGFLPDRPDGLKCDALIARAEDVFLFLLTADCLPVIIYEPEKKILALAHLGWRNTNQKFLGRLVEKLSGRYEADPERMLVGLGPGIKKESYLFPEEVVLEREINWPGAAEKFADGRVALDIFGYNIAQLRTAGVLEKNIEVCAVDTGSDTRFFSHYRASRLSGETEGRLATVAGMRRR